MQVCEADARQKDSPVLFPEPHKRSFATVVFLYKQYS